MNPLILLGFGLTLLGLLQQREQREPSRTVPPKNDLAPDKPVASAPKNVDNEDTEQPKSE